MLKKQEKRHRRHKRVRAKISGLAGRPRLCVFRSAKHIYAQLVVMMDGEKGKTLAAANDLELKQLRKPRPSQTKGGTRGKKIKSEENEKRTGKIAIAYEVGKLIAEKALKKKIKEVVFDRGGYAYHGRVKALAEGAREGGLKF